MKRQFRALEERQFDLVIVGAGIFGAAAAREAALRGLDTAVIDKGDFSHATSANHFKMVHCGIRYLQHGDFQRLRESSGERSALLRIAPHLVHNLPVLIPTYGHGMKGKEVLGAGALLYDLLTMDRNKGLLPEKKITSSRFLSARDVLEQFPELPAAGLTGGVVFDEGQMYNPPRLALAFLHSAVESGAVCANYVTATGFVTEGNRVAGITAIDTLDGSQIRLRARAVLNTAGPWAHRLLAREQGLALSPRPVFSRDLAVVIPRRFSSSLGLALTTDTKDADSIVDRGGRHLFAVPWQDRTLIGVWHKVCDCTYEEIVVTEEELKGFMAEINRAYPDLIHSFDDIRVVNTGLTLFGDANRQGTASISFGKRSQMIDHLNTHGMDGLFTLIGVRATTARGMAAQALDRICRRMGRDPGQVDSAWIPVSGGDFTGFTPLVTRVLRETDNVLSRAQVERLARNYGSKVEDVLSYGEKNRSLFQSLGDSTIISCEVVHAVREEMALTLGDVIFRRTGAGTGAPPSTGTLAACASLMARELGWSAEKTSQEIEQVQQAYPRLG